MAETERHERTEAPTQKRLDDARREGRIPRSRELTAAAVMVGAGALLMFSGRTLGGRLGELMRDGLIIPPARVFDEAAMIQSLGHLSLAALWAVAPVLGITLLLALGAPLALGGWAFSGAALVPDFSRLSPAAGLARMVSLRSWVELAKALGKFAIVGAAGVLVLKFNTDRLLRLGSEPLEAAIGHAIQITGQALIALTAAMVLIAAIDVPFQLWQYHRDLRMTREEIRQEHKESEGSPEIKGRIRALQREMAERRMMDDVPKADVVVVNPTHYAVALRYDEKTMRAPQVVAKGVDLMAARIREVASGHGVPIFEAPPLARALHRSVDIGDEIPTGLYVAVAKVLTYIFQLRAALRDYLPRPSPPRIEMPDEGK
ncbi:MAG TPA: flagellar biosynthesis protein FlhB [Steroidobacteraceae bacterium]|nr:flagellar biosynthesis protein FlhB [Steroidobacteraceae bacterium]